MKKELRDSLRHMQANPTTGTPHNQQVISTQVETIFAIDKLIGEIKTLSKIIDSSNKQGEKLEQSNYKLQVAMLVLTGMTMAIAAYQILNDLIQTTILTILLSLLTAVATFFIGKKFINHQGITLKESVKIRDKLDIVVTDSNGKVKERKVVK